MVKNLPANARRHGFNPWVRKIPWRRKWQPTPALVLRESHGQRSLAGCSPWGRRSQTRLSDRAHSLVCFASRFLMLWDEWYQHLSNVWPWALFYSCSASVMLTTELCDEHDHVRHTQWKLWAQREFQGFTQSYREWEIQELKPRSLTLNFVPFLIINWTWRSAGLFGFSHHLAIGFSASWEAVSYTWHWNVEFKRAPLGISSASSPGNKWSSLFRCPPGLFGLL